MNQALYENYLACKEAGGKSEATAFLAEFIASFATDEKAAWVRAFLEAGEYGHRIRHEIYTHLVFPVLREGFQRQDAWSLYGLAKTSQNLYADTALHAKMGYKTAGQFLREAYALAPTEEVRRALLDSLLDRFAYAQHEWPAGILYGNDGADLTECAEILQEVAFARTLDDGTHTLFLNEFESKVREYERRLQSVAATW